MDFGNRFSLEDFLAYLFPGIVGSIGIFILLLLTPAQATLLALDLNATTGILLIVVAYIIGIVLSNFAEAFFRKNPFRSTIKNCIPAEFDSGLITKAYSQIFDSNGAPIAWSSKEYYLCRILVFHYMPNVSSLINRQIGLRQLRMNLLPVYVIWFFAGLLWGFNFLSRGFQPWGIIILVGTLILSILLFKFTIQRMNVNESREVREVLSAFLAGTSTGIFHPIKN